MPEWQRQKYEELRDRYGGAMSAAAVGREIGLPHPSAYTKWLRPLTRNKVTKRYDTAEVAKKMYEERL
jgi:hypothetical protein